MLVPNESGPVIHISVVRDPFKFLSGDGSCVEQCIVPYTEAKSLKQYAEEIESLKDYNYTYAVALNGKSVTEFDQVFCIPASGDFISVCPTVGKGFGDIFKMVAMLALSIVAPYMIPEFVVEGLGMMMLEAVGDFAILSSATAFSLASSMLAGAVTLIGGVILNSVFPTSVPTTSGITDLSTASTTYGWDVKGNNADQDKAFPVLYGTVKIQPPIIGKYVSVDGDKQYLNVLMGVSEGPIESIDRMCINGNDISTYSDVEVVTRLGTIDQEIVPYFMDTFYDTLVGVVTTKDFFSATTSGNAVTGITVFLTSNGLYYANDSGGLSAVTVTCEIEYKKIGDSTWSSFPNGPFVVTENPPTKTAVRRGYSVENLDPDMYNVRVRRTTDQSTNYRTSDSVTFDYIQERISDDFIYPTRALWAVRALATDQLSGSMPTFTCYATRGTVSVYNPNTSVWEQKPSNQACWASYDILVNDVYGAGLPTRRALYDEFLNWESWIVKKGLTCNMYFDASMSVREALNHIGLSGRGVVVSSGFYYGVIVDKPEPASGMFTIGNMLKDSFELTYLSLKDRANVVELSYYDEAKDFSRQSVELVSSSFDEGTSTIVKSSVSVYSITDRQQALNYARFLLNCNEFQRRIAAWKTALDGFSAKRGAVVWCQHYVPYWGRGGRIVSGTTTSVTLPFSVDITAVDFYTGNTYAVGDVVLYYGQMYRCVKATETPSPAPGNLTYWSSSVYGLLLRRVPDVPDYTSMDVYDEGDYIVHEEVLYVSLVGGNYGNTPSLYSDKWGVVCDVIEHRTVTNGIGTHTTLYVNPSFDRAPQRGDVFSFGVIGKEAKKFRIITAGKSGNFDVAIAGMEYSDDLYEKDEPMLPYPTESSYSLVDNLKASETWKLSNGIGTATVQLTWTGYTLFWDVWMRLYPSGTWVKYTTTGTPMCEIPGLLFGYSYEFAVSPSTANSADAGRKVQLTFSGHPPIPSTSLNPSVSVNTEGATVMWSTDNSSWVFGYDIAIDGTVVEDNWTGSTYITRPLSSGLHTASVRSHDMFGQTGDWAVVQFSVDGPAKPDISAVIEGTNIRYNITQAQTVYPITSYKVREGSTYSGSSDLGSFQGTTAVFTAGTSNSVRRWFSAVDSAGNESTPLAVDVAVAAPGSPSMSVFVSGSNLLVSLAHNQGSLEISESFIYEGPVFATATLLFRGKVSSSRTVPGMAGTHTFWGVDVDSNGRASTPGSCQMTIEGPRNVKLDGMSVSNTAILSMNHTNGTLPFAYYEVRKGSTYEKSTLVNSTPSSSVPSVETVEGVYTYWCVAVDIAGNRSTPVSINLNIDQPPNYVLQTAISSIFSGESQNAYALNGKLVLPVDAGRKFADHLACYSWSSVQDKINAGFEFFLQPTMDAGYYKETVDFGSMIKGTKINVNSVYEILAGSARVECNIQVSADGKTWTDKGNVWVVYATNFRFVQVTITVTALE